jgi:hypothetical protein
MDFGDDLYDAKVTVLGEQVKHHVKEEELFPEVEAARVDIAELGKKMAARKAELMAKLAGDTGAGRSKISVDRAAAGNKPSK